MSAVTAGVRGPRNAEWMDVMTSHGAARARKQMLADRRGAERAAEFARWLAPDDRTVIDAVCAHGLSVPAVAALRGDRPVALRRRIARLVKRLGDPHFAVIVRHLQHWPAPRQMIARMIFLEKRTRREAARATGMTPYRLRREVEAIRVLITSDVRAERSGSTASTLPCAPLQIEHTNNEATAPTPLEHAA